MILRIDEVNKRSIPYKDYFDVMNLSEKQKRDRIEFAERMEDELFIIFSLFSSLRDYSVVNDNFIKKHLKDAYLSVVKSFDVPVDMYILSVATQFANDFVDVTRKHMNKLENKLPTGKTLSELVALGVVITLADAWYLSEDRIKFNSENEANTILNYKEYQEGIARFKYKTWHTENDDRVRDTHIPLEGETIPVGDFFVVGESLMRYPKDYEFAEDNPEELVNCRCSVSYHN